MNDSLNAQEALARLKEGNGRFVANVRSAEAMLTQIRRAELIDSHNPFAVILGCSDSRAPAEIVFDQGLGDLFVIRVAGNIVAPSQVGSVEFAIERFGIRLVLVMGHTHCGAIDATLEAIENPASRRSRNLLSIVERIRPAMEDLVADNPRADRTAILRHAMHANVRASVNQLRHGSRMLENLWMNDGLEIIGAAYDLETGVVDFFEKPVGDGTTEQDRPAFQ